MMPISFWILRRLENGIQYLQAKIPPTENIDQNNKSAALILESIITIFKENQIIAQSKTQKVKELIGMVISKAFYFGFIVGSVFCFDQIRSDGFRCRDFQNGTNFLLSNETKVADYLEMNFTHVFQTKKENGEEIW